MSLTEEKYSSTTSHPADKKSHIPLQKIIPSSLSDLGFDTWTAGQEATAVDPPLTRARVVEVNKNNFRVNGGQGELYAELAGRFLFDVDESTDYPTVGDWVAIQSFDDDSLAIIHQVLPRKTLLKRKDPGKATKFQLIAANIDCALIMQSADVNFNLNRLERYFVMAHESGIEPLVVLSKTDLAAPETMAEIQDSLERFHDRYKVASISSMTEEGIRPLQAMLEPGKTYCLLGSSGVGKTTLLNRLLGGALYETREVREKDHKGKHTTTRRQLILLPTGPIFIDTPGMRELGNFGAHAGMAITFDEIMELGQHCRFVDCTHVHEAGCAVKEAVDQGTLDEDRYENYLKMRKESAYYEMSYLEKRQKDKSFGKMVKQYKKSIRKK